MPRPYILPRYICANNWRGQLVPRQYILPQDIVPTTVNDNLCLGHIFCRVIFVATTGEDNLSLNVPHIVPTTGQDGQVAGMELVTFLPA